MTYEIALSPEAHPALREALLAEEIDALAELWGEPPHPRSARSIEEVVSHHEPRGPLRP